MTSTHITIRINPTTAANLRAIANHETSGNISHAIREALHTYSQMTREERNTNRSEHIL